MNLLSLGCGKDHRPGWVRLDCNQDNNPEILATVPPLPPAVLERRWHEVEAIHFLASLWPWEARELVKQLWQVLAPGGKLVIETPDLEFCCRHFLIKECGAYFEQFEEPESNTGTWRDGQLDMWGMYGNPAPQDKTTSNKWGFTPRTLRLFLMECGFQDTNIHQRPAQTHVPVRDFRMEAYR